MNASRPPGIIVVMIPARSAHAQPEERPRVALYGHDTLGLGHIRRNLALAGVLAPDTPQGIGADVLVLCGASEVGLFPRPAGVETLVLPGIRKDDDGRYQARSLRSSLESVVDLRTSTLHTALRSYAPEVVIVDKSPWGFHGELAGVLPLLKASGTRLVLGLRDVLDDARTTAAEWRRDNGDQAVTELYDEVWVYGDDRVHDVVASCGMSRAAAARTRHVGYLAAERPREDAGHRPLGTTPYVLVTVGGGQDGEAIVRAAAQLTPPDGIDIVVLAGPQVSDRQLSVARRDARRHPGMHLMRFSRHAAEWLRGAEAAVTMGGANTVAEILATDVPALVVPRVNPRREQIVRAQALHRHGALDVLRPDRVTTSRLSAWIHSRVGTRVDRSHLRLDGLAEVRRRTEALVTEHRSTFRPQPLTFPLHRGAVDAAV